MLPFPEYTNMHNGALNMAHHLPQARRRLPALRCMNAP
jgi:hypothetical protein